MKSLKIVGVPEHFNLPWHLAIDENAFGERGIALEWTDVPEGTGRMCQMLRDGETDIAIILTEGIVKDITTGNPSKIVQTYVESPLLWGIHVGAQTPIESLEEIKNGKIAISRYGSGSHLMAYINAKNQGWDVTDLRFEVINNLDGAIEALTNETADYFMWEHFTTKPIVDKGVFKRIGDCPTPWPCFVVAVRNEILEQSPSIIKHVLDVINAYTAEFKQIPSIDRTIANRYEQKLEDIQKWLTLTEWSQQQISEAVIKNVQQKLTSLHILDKNIPYNELVFSH